MFEKKPFHESAADAIDATCRRIKEKIEQQETYDTDDLTRGFYVLELIQKTKILKSEHRNYLQTRLIKNLDDVLWSRFYSLAREISITIDELE